MSVRNLTKEVAARVLCAAGVPQLSLKKLRGHLAILMFHGVEAQPLWPSCPYVIDSATLRRNLKYMANHFNILSLDEALTQLAAGTLPDRAAALTFDDGTRNLATHAAPILRELGLPAAIFLATGPMGTPAALWPDRLWLGFANTRSRDIDLTKYGLGCYELRAASDRACAWQAVTEHLKNLPDVARMESVEALINALGPGVDADPGPFEMLSWDDARLLIRDERVALYPHTVTHPILSRCDDEKVDYEISESCLTVQRETGKAPHIFAYPNGRAADFDIRAKSALRRNGIRWALATTRGFADENSDPLALPRIGISLDQSYAMFRLRVSGALS